MQKALITGGLGFVGWSFAKRLLKDGWVVSIVDNLSASQYPDTDEVFRFSQTDVRTFVRGCQPDPWDLIIHCAAVVGGRQKIEGDPLAVATDLAIDSDFFNWIARSNNKKQRVVYFSSSAVYPIELQTERNHCALSESLVDLSKSRIGMPDQTYGWSKLTGELLAQHAVKTYGTKVVIYRPFSGYGEGQSFDYPFPSIIRRVLNKENPVMVWGSGRQQRDWIHIEDIVDCVMQTYAKLDPGEVLNIGTGVGTPFFVLPSRVQTTLQVPYEDDFIVRNDPTKPEGVFARYADVHKMLQFYQPKVSLEEGIHRVAKSLDKTKEAV